MTTTSMHDVQGNRIRFANQGTPNGDGDFVVYWMTAARRLRFNHALQVAAGEAAARQKPLLVFEALRAGHRWANDRFHRFALDGMADHARRLASAGVAYFPYVEPRHGDGAGLLEALAARSCLVVTDDYPCYFLPRMLEAAAGRLAVPLIAVDSNGLLPMRATDRVFTAAYHFRRFLQRALPDHLDDGLREDPLERRMPEQRIELGDIADRWRPATAEWLLSADTLRDIEIDHSVAPVPDRGGEEPGLRALQRFVEDRLPDYADRRSEPDANVASGLSPWLHWGHISAHEVFRAITSHEGWTPGRLSSRVDGRKSGWWGMSPSGEAFLDELVTWRELGFNMTSQGDGYDRWDSLPEWARATLTDHEADPRPTVYSIEQFETAETHEPLWNAAQRELLLTGRIQNYLRMLWGKKILEWSRSPREALTVMIELNNRYALDGRDPNSYSGIFWCLGRYDRPWPERAIFGKVRSMSSDSTRRKFRTESYLRQFGA